jgi:hypothetical protein
MATFTEHENHQRQADLIRMHGKKKPGTKHVVTFQFLSNAMNIVNPTRRTLYFVDYFEAQAIKAELMHHQDASPVHESYKNYTTTIRKERAYQKWIDHA